MKFDLRSPCDACPFRADRFFPLRPGRVEEIERSMCSGAIFPCHKTVEYGDDGEGVETSATQACFGGLMVFEESYGLEQHGGVRLWERLGAFTFDGLIDRVQTCTTPVYDDFFAYIDACIDHDA